METPVTSHRHSRARRRRPWPLAAAAVLLLAVVAIVAVVAINRSSSGPQASGGTCAELNVPAYFSAAEWASADLVKPAPGTIILNPSTGIGAGSSVNPSFVPAVRQAQKAGVTVLGYISTVDGQRPVSQVEADIRHYKSWYGVTAIFFDRVSALPQYVTYYRQLATYVHQLSPGAEVWLNPGIYPTDTQYMSIANVVMVFEGSYAQYQSLQVPSWAGSYPASKFADTVYATLESQLPAALALARHRHAGHIYVTDDVEPNPYASLPSYWTSEVSAVGAECHDGTAIAAPALAVRLDTRG